MGKNTDRARRMSAVRSQARLFLMEALCEGPRTTRDIRNGHLARELSASIINLAAKDLRIQKRRVGNQWTWRLPTVEEWRTTGDADYARHGPRF